MGGANKTTIYDIARLAGTSAATVSYSLNGNWAERRIAPATADRIRAIAAQEGYQPNRQARGLRRGVTGLSGLVLPEHDTRFFSELSQAFALAVRARGDCPAIVLSGRDPEEQASSLRSLIGYNIDSVMIAGATAPQELARQCRAAQLPHVFVDHPCPGAPSVTTDNRAGAHALTARLVEGARGTRPYFLGGTPGLPSTEDRARGFREAALAAGLWRGEDQVDLCGYGAAPGEAAIAALAGRLGRLPEILFVNSISCFEGVVRHLAGLPEREILGMRLGCFDYDPFATVLRFPVTLVRQRAGEIVRRAFASLDGGEGAPELIQIEPELIAPR